MPATAPMSRDTWSSLSPSRRVRRSDNPDRPAGPLEHSEDRLDLFLRVLGAERTAQEGHVGRSCRRAREVDVEAFLEERFPHHGAALEVGHDHRDDRTLRGLGAEREAEALEPAVEALGI